MNKDQPNADKKINAGKETIAQPTEGKGNQGVCHILNQPRPEIVEACLQSKNKKDPKEGQTKKGDTLGDIYHSMEKLGNAICLENGLYKTNPKEKGKQRKALRLNHLKRKTKGKGGFY
jgi:hypothetical protein